MGKTYVSAVVRARDGRERELEQALASVVGTVRNEAGCLCYVSVRGTASPASLPTLLCQFQPIIQPIRSLT